jgi:hypothetical protein
MDVDRLPAWLKALAVWLWAVFVLAPLFVWLSHHLSDTVLLAAPPALAVAYWLLLSRASDDGISDAEYYRRKARGLRSTARHPGPT